jgi:hypothetical protein
MELPVSQGSVVSAIGYGINSVISAIAAVLETIIGAIVAVRTFCGQVLCISSESAITGNRSDLRHYYRHSMLSLLRHSPHG